MRREQGSGDECGETIKQIFDNFTVFQIEIIEYWGYPAEVHEVITSDGYILEMFRIARGTLAIKSKLFEVFRII